jgi:hypothetical protein
MERAGPDAYRQQLYESGWREQLFNASPFSHSCFELTARVSHVSNALRFTPSLEEEWWTLRRGDPMGPATEFAACIGGAQS